MATIIWTPHLFWIDVIGLVLMFAAIFIPGFITGWFAVVVSITNREFRKRTPRV